MYKKEYQIFKALFEQNLESTIFYLKRKLKKLIDDYATNTSADYLTDIQVKLEKS